VPVPGRQTARGKALKALKVLKALNDLRQYSASVCNRHRGWAKERGVGMGHLLLPGRRAPG
jgi:hypothetical protein